MDTLSMGDSISLVQEASEDLALHTAQNMSESLKVERSDISRLNEIDLSESKKREAYAALVQFLKAEGLYENISTTCGLIPIEHPLSGKVCWVLKDDEVLNSFRERQGEPLYSSHKHTSTAINADDVDRHILRATYSGSSAGQTVHQPMKNFMKKP